MRNLPVVMKAWRESEGMSIRTLSSKLGVSYRTYAYFEKGEHSSTDLFCTILKWLMSNGSDRPD